MSRNRQQAGAFLATATGRSLMTGERRDFLSPLADSPATSRAMSRIPDASIIHSRLRLRQLRLMLALQEFGSLRRAAEEIGMTQPAATKMLHEAESLLGVELFERLPRGMRATAFGETAIYYAKMIFAELSGMREEFAALESGNLGRVTIGAIPALASGLLTRTIATLKKSHPRLSMSIQVDTSDVLVQALQQDQLDVVLGRIPDGARTDDLLFDSLGEETLCVVAGAGFGVLKAKLPSFVKAGIAGAAVVVIAMMLSIDAKFWGVVVMGGAVIILFFLPWLDHSPVKSIRYRPDLSLIHI